jgi:hypothetical protein
MRFTVEILFKGTDRLVTESLEYVREPAFWTDDDVREVMKLALRTFDEIQQPERIGERTVTLRGLSWIVTPLPHHGGGRVGDRGEKGVAIAIEIPSGAVMAGPFDIDAAVLTELISRVLGGPEIDRTTM